MSDTDRDAPDDEAIAVAEALLGELKRIADAQDVPTNLRKLSRFGVEQIASMLETVRAGNAIGVEEIVLGTRRDGRGRHPDGLRQVLPRWARGVAVLEALAGVVVVDESKNPVAVTVHWDRVPRKLRPAAASLASELVDLYQPRPLGGRGRKSVEGEFPETG